MEIGFDRISLYFQNNNEVDFTEWGACMKAATKVTFFDENGEKFFGEGPAHLLRGIEEKGSLRSAAMSMGMAYTKALRILKNAEAALGFSLTTRTTGGRDGGGSILTPEGKAWLERYEAYRDACSNANRALLRQFFPSVGCVIMASGMSKRFGSNKLMADFDGKPMILKALEASRSLRENRVVVTRHEDVAKLCREQGVNVVLHDLPHRSDTVRLGMEALGDVDCCMFLPADQPLLRPESVAQLMAQWEANRQNIVRPFHGEIPGSPVIFPRWTFEELRNLPKGKGGGWVMQNHPDQITSVQIDDPYELMDADTPETLEMLRNHHKRK